MAQQEITRPRGFCERAGISHTTLYVWVRKGLVPKPVQYGPRITGWPTSVVDQWFRERAAALAPPTPAPGATPPPWLR